MVHKSNIHNKILIADLQLATAAACYGMAIAGQKVTIILFIYLC